MSKTISVLGCGWLGLPLAKSLLKKGNILKGSTTSLDKIELLESFKIQPFLVDISLDQTLDDFLNTDVLIIAITSKDIDGFKTLISKIEQAPVKNIIFISSTSVYPNLNRVVTEKDATVDSPLATIEKLFINNINFKTTILRFSGLFGGERQPANWFKGGRAIPQPEGFVNLIHQVDCIQIIEKIIEENSFGEIFNASTNHNPKRRVFYTKVKVDNGFEKPVFKEDEPLSWKIISSEKLQQKLNYKFTVNDLLKI